MYSACHVDTLCHAGGPNTGCTRPVMLILCVVQEDLLIDVLGLSHQYGFVELQSAISGFLKDNLKVLNVCLIYDIASLYALTSLAQACCEFMICNATDVLHSDAFLSLSPVSHSHQQLLHSKYFTFSERFF